MYGGLISTFSKEQQVELASAPPSAVSRQMFRAAAGDQIQPLLHPVVDLAFYSFITNGLGLTLPSRSASTASSLALPLSQSRPSLQHRGRNCSQISPTSFPGFLRISCQVGDTTRISRIHTVSSSSRFAVKPTAFESRHSVGVPRALTLGIHSIEGTPHFSSLARASEITLRSSVSVDASSKISRFVFPFLQLPGPFFGADRVGSCSIRGLVWLFREPICILLGA